MATTRVPCIRTFGLRVRTERGGQGAFESQSEAGCSYSFKNFVQTGGGGLNVCAPVHVYTARLGSWVGGLFFGLLTRAEGYGGGGGTRALMWRAVVPRRLLNPKNNQRLLAAGRDAAARNSGTSAGGGWGVR